MIPLYKLEKLPRIVKLRKINKVFSMAENRLALAVEKSVGIYAQAEFVFFTNAAKLLAKDSSFSPEAQRVFAESAVVFEQAIHTVETDAGLFRRALNNVKHILLAETGRDQADWDFTASDGSLDPTGRQIFKGMYVYMEDIRSPFNVGAMFRTAESFGVEKIFLSPFCADPHHTRSRRTAMGCVDIVPWEKRELFAVEAFPQTAIFALEIGGVPLEDFSFPQEGLLIAGSEELGVSPHALAAADASLGRVSIPCYGAKASLNVSVAFGIALNSWAQILKNK